MHQKKDAAHPEACEAPQQLMKSAQGMNSCIESKCKKFEVLRGA
jgi:hypothetical protein